jgi:hypothetical protein
MLVEPTEEGHCNLVDIEDTVNWASKFPNTRFGPLDNLEAKDAELAISIVFQTLRCLSDCLGRPFTTLSCLPEFSQQVIFRDEIEIEQVVIREGKHPINESGER